MSSRLPNCWKHVSLSSISERIRQRNSFANSNVLTISAAYGLVNQKNFFNKIVASENLSNYFILRKGDFAYNKSYSQGYPVGVVRRLERYESGVLSPLYICFSITNPAVDQRYAQYYFDSQYFIDEINQIAKEGVRNHGLLNVGVNDFFNIEFVSPPLPEQQKIATILSSVDDVIEKTRAQIDKLKDLKTGMMQELLTQGIGHTEFKDSPVGLIPTSWQVKEVDEVLREVIDYRGKSPPKSEKGVPLITAKNVRQGYITEEPKEYIYEDQYDSWMVRGMPSEGDILITTEAPLGNVAKVPSYKFALGQRLLALSPSDIVTSDFLLYLMQGKYFQEQLELQSTGSTVTGIKQSTFRKILIAVPPLNEQYALVKPLKSMNLRLQNLQLKLAHAEDLKKAIMQDLLTGQVRVKVEHSEIVAA